MKKYLVLFGAVILVMALASPSMAQFKSWGHIEIMTVWEAKPDFNTGGAWQFDVTRDRNRAISYKNIAERYRFYLQYGDAKTVRAVLGFEADSADFGEAAGGGTAGNNTTFPPFGTAAYQSGSNHMGVYRTDQVQLEIKHAYLDFTVPNTPVSVMAGLLYVDVAGRMFMMNDAAGVIVTANFAPNRIRGLWWRINDNNRFSYGVNDMYALTYDLTKQAYNIGLWGAYSNDLFSGNIGSYSYTAAVTGATAATFGVNPAPGAVETQTYALTLTTPVNKYNDHPWWVGVSGGYRPGNWDFWGQFIYNGGKRQFEGTPVNSATGVNNPALPATITGDTTYQAWAAEIAGKYRIGPGLFAGLEGYYATGQDWRKPDKITQYNFSPGNPGVSANTVSSESGSNFGNDRTVFMWMNAAQMGYYHERNFSPEGFAYARGNVEYSPLTWVRMNFNYLYIWNTSTGPNAATGSGVGATVISPFTRLATNAQPNSPLGARQDKQYNYVGQEINVITTFRIYQNFDYNVGIFLFFPGQMFDRLNSDGSTFASAGPAWGCNTKLIYAF